MDREEVVSIFGLAFDIVFAIYHLVYGIVTRSLWLLTLGSYYLVLSVVRFVVLRSKATERFISKFTGWMLLALSLPLIGTVILSVVSDRGHKLHTILIITMAVYAFTKITLATIKFIKARCSTSARVIALRNVSFATAFVSIFALQRSMLVSFEGMRETEIVIMNATLGSAVCVIVILLGFNLVRNKKILFRSIER